MPSGKQNLLYTDNLLEVPGSITVGKSEDIIRYNGFVDNLLEEHKYHCMIPVGTRRYMVLGDLYRDLLTHPSMIRLGEVKELGIMHGERRYLDSETGKTRKSSESLVSAHQRRVAHCLDLAVRNEIATRINSSKEEHVSLAIASGLLHDLYSAALSDQGRLADWGALDEERNIELILEDHGLVERLWRNGVDPEDVISAVRGEHPVIGSLINSGKRNTLDMDRVSYTLTDMRLVGISQPESRLFHDYKMDPYVLDIHEYVNTGEGLVFYRPEAVRRLLYVRAWLSRDNYKSSSNRAGEAFLENELKRLRREGKLRDKYMHALNDHGFEEYLRGVMDPEVFKRFFSRVPGYFEEIARFYFLGKDDVEGLYTEPFIVKQEHAFSPATDTLVLDERRGEVPFREIFPEDAEKIDAIAGSCKYVGVYMMR